MKCRRFLRAAPLVALAAGAGASVAFGQVTERMFVDSGLAIPQSVLATCGAVLPESSNVGASFLSGTYDPNLVVTAPAHVFITFVHEGAGYKNSLGYFTYTTNAQGISITSRQLVFPNASFADPTKGLGGGGKLASGDTVTLRDATGAPRIFQPNERIGFFLVADGWNGTGVRGWNEAAPAIPSTSAATNAAGRVFTSIDPMNPEASAGRSDLSRHIAMMRIDGTPGFLDGNDFLLMGFEDQRRDTGSDNDFNDLVLIIQSDPADAVISNVPLYEAENPDPDGDGVQGLADFFPNDPERAFIVRTPTTGWQTLAFEDTYPHLGDGDYNDCVVDLAFEEVLRADGALKDLSGTFHLVARGANLDHALGVNIPGMPSNAGGTIDYERFAPDGTRSFDAGASIANRFEGAGAAHALLIDDVFTSTKAAFTDDAHVYTNTQTLGGFSPPASSRFKVTFDEAIPRAPLGTAPFDPYLAVQHEEESWDIHLPGKSGLPGRPDSLPEESGARSFTDADGYPFAMLLPTAFRYPLERVRIDTAYPSFTTWRSSQGVQAKTWYGSPSSATPARVIAPLSETLRSRPWTITSTSAQ
ncbi:MAG: LruC domain-containing protein [Polyangiaceae bacterium]|nr:LruC domain-containing protein [Polyangiaceae bacterium]